LAEDDDLASDLLGESLGLRLGDPVVGKNRDPDPTGPPRSMLTSQAPPTQGTVAVSSAKRR
jgi:hypothetical protein